MRKLKTLLLLLAVAVFPLLGCARSQPKASEQEGMQGMSDMSQFDAAAKLDDAKGT